MRSRRRQLRDEIVRTLDVHLEDFVEIPSAACPCGRPIVFPHPRRTFLCTRCGAQYRLVVRIEAVRR